MRTAGSESDYLIVLVTAGSEQEAQQIAQTLVREQWAACVSMTAIASVYTWENQVQQEQEWQLIIKTLASQFAGLAQRVQELHSYQVPEIIALPIVAGAASYLDWLRQQVKPADPASRSDSAIPG